MRGRKQNYAHPGHVFDHKKEVLYGNLWNEDIGQAKSIGLTMRFSLTAVLCVYGHANIIRCLRNQNMLC